MAERAVLLTGGLGSGKTSVATEIGELLAERGTPHAVVDLDWLCWCEADWIDAHRMLTANLRAVWGNYRAAGIRRLVMARALLEPAHADAVRQALGGTAELTVVRLAADPATVRARLSGRDSGTVLRGHLAEFEDFEARIEKADLHHATVRNDGAPLREVAARVLEAAGW